MQVLLGSRQRDRLAALRPPASVPSVPVPAWSGRVQQAAAQVGRAAAGDDPAARRGHRRVGRRHLADRLDTDRVRPVAAHRRNDPTSPAGPATATARRTRGTSGGCACTSCAPRPGCRSRSPWPTRKSTNATSPSTCSTPNPACSPAATARRSSPTRATSRPSSNAASPTTASNSSARPATTNDRRRGARQLALAAPDHRIGQQHPESPAQPRTPRRPQPTRRHRPHPPTTPRPHRRDLAQPPQPPTRPPIAHRLRPLRPLGFSHLVADACVRSTGSCQRMICAQCV